MSGIYITGVEMPKHDDEYVIFTVYGDGGVVYSPLNRPHVRYKNRAVPVPDHGEVIRKADAISVLNNISNRTTNEIAKDALCWAKESLSVLPTIIPADKEGV